MYVFVQAVRGLPYSLEGCEFISLDFLSPRNQKKLLLSNDLYLSLETHWTRLLYGDGAVLLVYRQRIYSMLYN